MYTMYRSTTTQNLRGLDFDPARSHKVKSYGAVGLPIYILLVLKRRI